MGERKINERLFHDFRSAGGLHVSEMLYLSRLCNRHECKAFLEIGRKLGTSTRLFALHASVREGRVVSIDGNAQHMGFVVKKLEEHGLEGYVEMITAFSPWVPFDMQWVFDCLLIDGNHSYIPTLVDYHTFNYFVRQGGLVAFHDVHLNPVNEAMLQAAKTDSMEMLGRHKSLQVWMKTLPWGRKR